MYIVERIGNNIIRSKAICMARSNINNNKEISRSILLNRSEYTIKMEYHSNIVFYF